MPLDFARTAGMLLRDEGQRLTVYDDATGLPLKPGMTLKGWPTIGVGRNLADPGITAGESYGFLSTDIHARYAELVKAKPFVADLSPARTAVLVSMAFMGVEKLLRFRRMFAHLAARNFAGAAEEMQASVWWTQVGRRGPRLVEQLLSDSWPA